MLDDGRIDFDTNTVERIIRPVALGRKYALFAGSDGGADRWATIGTLTTATKLNDIEPQTWITDVQQRMTGDHPTNRLDDLLPCNRQPGSN